LADLFISLWLRGLLPRAVRIGRAAPAALLLAFVAYAGVPSDAQAQQRPAPAPSTQPPSAPQAPSAPGRTASTEKPVDRPAPPPLSEEQALKGALDVRLAYIVTGDKEVDDISRQGLEGLSEILRNRTSVEPGDPVGLDLEKDEPRLYPMIYWPITST